MALTFIVLFCLGLSLGHRTSVLTGILPKPNIRAEPGSVVSLGQQVAIVCEGTRDAQGYSLYKNTNPVPLDRKTPLEPRNKATFSIPFMEEASAGQYLCYYQTPAGRSERSNILELTVTGVYNNKPTLTALSSPMVTSGGNVTLLCVAQRYDKLILITEDQKFSISLDSQKLNIRKVQAQFSLGPVNLSNRGVFRCHGSYKGNPLVWSEPSDSLEIHVSGMSRKPSLLTPKDPILAPGENLTLKCSSDSGHDRFALSKKGRIDLFQKPGHYLRAEISHASFPLGPVSSSHAGQYRCYGAHNFSSEWSAPSDPLDILIKESSTLPSSSWTSGSIPTIVQREMDLQHPGGLQRWYSETKALRKDASLKDTQLEDSMELDIQSPPDEDVHGVIYAQSAAFEDGQDTTYAQLCILTPGQGQLNPFLLDREVTAESREHLGLASPT